MSGDSPGVSELEWVEIDDLHPAPWNPREMTPEQRDALGRSLDAFGAADPAIVRPSDKLIIGGHQRVMVAREDRGWLRFPVVWYECSDTEARQLNVALNKITGGWELRKLGELLDGLRSTGADTDVTGFGEDEVTKLIDSLSDDGPDDFGQADLNWNVECPRCGHKWRQ